MPRKDPERARQQRREYYLANKDLHRESQRQHRQRTLNYVHAIRNNACCKQCGEDHPATLDLHHRNPEEKEAGFAKMIRDKWSKVRIDAELKKCDILCANCHRKLHWPH